MIRNVQGSNYTVDENEVLFAALDSINDISLFCFVLTDFMLMLGCCYFEAVASLTVLKDTSMIEIVNGDEIAHGSTYMVTQLGADKLQQLIETTPRYTFDVSNDHPQEKTRPPF